MDALAQVHEKIPGLLDAPRPVRVGGDAEDVHVPATDPQDEKHVQTLEGEGAVHMEEVAGEHGRRLGAQESAPRGVVAADRCRRDAQPFEDSADR